MTARALSLVRAGVIVAAVAMAYLPAAQGGFVFDDHGLIESGPANAAPVWRAWVDATSPDYWPLTMTALWVEHRAFGSSPLGYHLVNLALHALAALLLWAALRAVRVPGSWLAALLFAVHPAAVETVAWISEQKNTLSAVLYLCAALAWLRWYAGGRPGWLALSTGVFLLACLAKASVVILPIVLAGVVLYRRRRLGRRELLGLAPLLLVAIAAGLVTLWFQHHNAAQGWAPERGWSARLGAAGFALGWYLRAAFLPGGWGLVHAPWPAVAGPLLLLPAALLASLGVALAAAARRWAWTRPLAAGLAYHALAVLPVLGIVELTFFRVSPVSNHLQYLALMGPAALFGWGVATLASRSPVVLPSAAALLAALAFGTFVRAGDYRDDLRLWTAAVRDAPGSAFAHDQLARIRSARGDKEGAREELAAAWSAEQRPAWRALRRALWLRSVGRADEAAVAAREAIAGTREPEVRRDAAEVLLAEGAAGDALPVLQELVAASPRASDYTYLFANALWRLGRRSEAVEVLARFRREHPGQPLMDKALALALAGSGRRDEALVIAAEAAGVPVGAPVAEQLLTRWLAR